MNRAAVRNRVEREYGARRARAAAFSAPSRGARPRPLPEPLLQKKPACACGGGCPRCQRKLAVSQPGDIYEQEADRVADQVMRMPAPAAQRKCAACTAGGTTCPKCAVEKEKEVRRKAEGARPSSAPGGLLLDIGSGQPLDSAARNFFEPRFGRDFGDIRVHTDAKAAGSAAEVDALAYTAGRDIVFGSGRYAPHTPEGQKLLAHELTHFVQQGSVGAAPAVQRQTGTSVYTEHSDVTSTSIHEPGVWSGTVRREERTAEGRLFHTGRAPVRYDENSCGVTIPMTVSFRRATLADVQNCPPGLDQPAPAELPPAVSDATLRSLAERYIQTLNEDLSGWYAVRFHGCETNRCHGRDMPIQVQVSEASAGGRADYEVAVANLRGRSCVDDSDYRTGGTGLVLLYAIGLERGTMAHEGLHMALGHGDEYREEEEPGPGRPEDRVREGDWSHAASHHSYGRFSLMHERHYEFVPFYLNQVRPGCDARLVEMTRPPPIDVTIELGIGYAGFAGRTGETGGLYEGLGISWGVPLSRLREWELIVGLHGRWLAELEEQRRQAFLLGVRLGIEHTFSPSAGGFTAGGFGEAGVGWLPGGFGSYAEGGAYLGYTTSPLFSGLRIPLRVEGALGIAAPAVGTIGEPGAPASSDPETLRYFRLGLSAAFRF